MAENEQSDKYKVLVIGDYGVGKTSIIRRYIENIFNPKYKLTIGVDFSSKYLHVDGRRVELQLWDIAGHERFGHMTHVYYKHAIAAIIVFDIGRPATFDSVTKWHKDLTDKVANSPPLTAGDSSQRRPSPHDSACEQGSPHTCELIAERPSLVGDGQGEARSILQGEGHPCMVCGCAILTRQVPHVGPQRHQHR